MLGLSLTDALGLDDHWVRPVPTQDAVRLPLVGAVPRVDLLVGAVVAALVAGVSWLLLPFAPGATGREWTVLVAAVVLGLIVSLRRVAPVVQGCLAMAHWMVASYTVPVIGTTTWTQYAYAFSFYSMVAWSANRRRAWALMGALTGVIVVWAMTAFATSKGTAELMHLIGRDSPSTGMIVRMGVLTLLINLAFAMAAGVMGQLSWWSARRSAALVEQNELIARQNVQLAEQAVVSERLRIARDIHDSVAHHVAVIGIQAAGARRAMELSPDLAKEALGVVEQESREAVSEMRSLVGSLRTGDAGVQPGIGDLTELCQRARAVRVGLDVVGDPTGVAQPVAVAVYRVVQEALNNVEKHSGATRATVAVRIGEEVEVEVTDDGFGGGGAGGTRPAGTGVGLKGMAERVGLLGGSLEAGPRVTRGWRVRAVLPRIEGRS